MKILVLFYSLYGHMYQMVSAAAEGATLHRHHRQPVQTEPPVPDVAASAPEDRPMKSVTKDELVERALEVEVMIDGEVATEEQLTSSAITKATLVELIREACSTSVEGATTGP